MSEMKVCECERCDCCERITQGEYAAHAGLCSDCAKGHHETGRGA